MSMRIKCGECGEFAMERTLKGILDHECAPERTKQMPSEHRIGGTDTHPVGNRAIDRVRIPADNPGIKMDGADDPFALDDDSGHPVKVRDAFERCAKILDPMSEVQRGRVIRALAVIFDA